ncbi:MAG: SCO family protein [Proteobacteria bacterium]|nr:SCO family protein [Pseudomonadota bacterium]
MFEKIVEGFKKSPYLWTAVVSMIVITIVTPLTRRVPQPPPVVSALPEFTLTGPDGKPFGSRELAGRTYIASFLFTRCQSVCPMITQHLVGLQARILHDKIPLTLVSITVDPENDTPSVLKAFAEKSGASGSVWTFLTGSRTSVTEIVEKGFTVGMGAPTVTNGLMDVAHSQKLILVDSRGRIRGFYDASGEGVDEIYARAEAVVGETLL